MAKNKQAAQAAEKKAAEQKAEQSAPDQPPEGPTAPAATNPPAAPGKGKGGKVAVLRVQAKRERFRRAGLTFGRTEVALRLEDLSADQVKALKAEPMLVVTEDEAEL